MRFILWLAIGCVFQIIFYSPKIVSAWSFLHILLWPIFLVLHLIVWGLYSLVVIIPVGLMIVGVTFLVSKLR